jgi:hypothetical protein
MESPSGGDTLLYPFSTHQVLRCFLTITLLIAPILLIPSVAAFGQGTTFSFQGKLNDGGNPANGTYDFEFKLFDLAIGGTQQGPTAPLEDVQVTNGTFTVQLDFGANFAGANRFLEIMVRPGASTGAFSTLVPRRQVTSTPYALQVDTAHVAEVSTSQAPPGLTGPPGPPGPTGTTGPTGPTLTTVAACYFGELSPPCVSGTVSSGNAPCETVSSTGSCDHPGAGGTCAICKALTTTTAVCGTGTTCNCPHGTVVGPIAGPCFVTSSTGSCERPGAGGICCVCKLTANSPQKDDSAAAAKSSPTKVKRKR